MSDYEQALNLINIQQYLGLISFEEAMERIAELNIMYEQI